MSRCILVVVWVCRENKCGWCPSSSSFYPIMTCWTFWTSCSPSLTSRIFKEFTADLSPNISHSHSSSKIGCRSSTRVPLGFLHLSCGSVRRWCWPSACNTPELHFHCGWSSSAGRNSSLLFRSHHYKQLEQVLTSWESHCHCWIHLQDQYNLPVSLGINQ